MLAQITFNVVEYKWASSQIQKAATVFFQEKYTAF